MSSDKHPKIKHGSAQGVKVLSPEEVRALGISTDPVLVISPVPRTPLTTPPTKQQQQPPKMTDQQARLVADIKRHHPNATTEGILEELKAWGVE